MALIALAILAGSTVVLLVSSFSDSSKASLLRHHGVPVEATVTRCAGISSGVGMGVVYYQCWGSFSFGGPTFEEVIVGSRAQLSTGSTVAARVVPSRPGTLTLASAVPAATTAGDFTAPIVVGALTLAGGAALALRHRRGAGSEPPADGPQVGEHRPEQRAL
jgi:hypothetical protein